VQAYISEIMLLINEILVPVTSAAGTDDPGLLRALQLAQAFDATVVLQGVVTEQSEREVITSEAQSSPELQEIEQQIERLAEQLQLSRATTVVSRAPTRVDGIVQTVEATHPDLVVTTRHNREHRLQDPDFEKQLIETCSSALCLAAGIADGDSRGNAIVAAVDPLHERDKPAILDHFIIAFAKGIAERLSLPLHVVHGVFSFDLPEEYRDTKKTRHEDALQRLLDPYAVRSTNVHIIQ